MYDPDPFELLRKYREWVRKLWEFPEGEVGIKTITPKMDVIDKDDKYVIRLEMPGFKKNEIQVRVGEGYLEVEAEHKEEKEEKREGILYSERSYGRVYRQIPLPANADVKSAKAKLKDGVLHIELKKVKAKEQEVPVE